VRGGLDWQRVSGRYFDGTHYRFKSLRGRWLAIHPNEVGGGSGGDSCLLTLTQVGDHVLISSADGKRAVAFSGDGKKSHHPEEVGLLLFMLSSLDLGCLCVCVCVCLCVLSVCLSVSASASASARRWLHVCL
jgi:hypothetical protein